MDICVYSEVGGVRQVHLSLQYPSSRRSLREAVYICIHTYPYIYIYTSRQHLRIRLLKNTDCFTTIAPLTFIIIHSKNFHTHGLRNACTFYIARFALVFGVADMASETKGGSTRG